MPAGDDRFLKHLGEGYLNRPNPEYARSRVAQIINGRIKPLPQIDNADLETLLSYLIPDRTLYEFWQHDDSWCQHLLSGAARAVFRLVAGTDLYGKRDCCLSDSLYRSLIQRIDLLPLLDGQQSFLREVVSHACTRPGSLTGMQARVESLFPMVDKPSRVLMPPLPTVVVMPPVLPNPEPSVLTVDSAAAEVDPSLEVNPLIGAGDGAPSELVEPEGSDVPHELIDSVVAGVESDSLTEAGAAGLTDPEEAAASSLESESPAFCPVDFKKAWTALIGHVNSKKRHKRSGFMDSLLSVCNAKEKDFRRYTRIVIKIANSADIALLDQTDLERILGYVVPDTALYESYKNKDLDEDLARVYRLVKLTKCRLSTESATELQRRIRSLPESAQRQNLIILVEEAARNPRTPTFSIEGLEKAFSEGESLASRRR